MGRNRGRRQTQCRFGRGLPPYEVALIDLTIWPQQMWAENWGAVPRWGGEPRPTCMPSFTLIRPTVWPECTDVTDRQRGEIYMTDRQRSDSIGRTVLQKVAPKLDIL